MTVSIELFDSNGKLVGQYVKQPEERILVPVQIVSDAVSYKMTWPSGKTMQGQLIPVYEF